MIKKLKLQNNKNGKKIYKKLESNKDCIRIKNKKEYKNK